MQPLIHIITDISVMRVTRVTGNGMKNQKEKIEKKSLKARKILEKFL